MVAEVAAYADAADRVPRAAPAAAVVSCLQRSPGAERGPGARPPPLARKVRNAHDAEPADRTSAGGHARPAARRGRGSRRSRAPLGGRPVTRRLASRRGGHRHVSVVRRCRDSRRDAGGGGRSALPQADISSQGNGLGRGPQPRRPGARPGADRDGPAARDGDQLAGPLAVPRRAGRCRAAVAALPQAAIPGRHCGARHLRGPGRRATGALPPPSGRDGTQLPAARRRRERGAGAGGRG